MNPKPSLKYQQLAQLIQHLPEEWLAEFLRQTEGTDGTVVLDSVWPSVKTGTELIELLEANL
jgi:hypothetical protein